MKKLTVLITALLISYFAFCQEEAADANGITWGMVVSAVQKSDANVDNVKKNAKSGFWQDRGKFYARYYEYDLKGIYYGIGKDYITPTQNTKTEGEFEIWSYDRLDIFLKKGTLHKYIRTGNFLTDMKFPEAIKSSSFELNIYPLTVAIEAYKKAVELDASGKSKPEIGTKLKAVADNLLSDAYMAFYNNDSETALKTFDQIVGIYNLDYVKVADSILNPFYTNCGIIAKSAKKYDKAIEYYKQAAERGVGGVSIYGELYVCYNNLGDSAQAAEMLKLGIEKNPNDKGVVELTNVLINYYLAKNKNEEAKAYLEKAMSLKSDVAVYPFSLGFLYSKEGNIGKADEMYKKALSVDGNYLDAYLNLGVMYVEYANKILNDANNIKDVKAYEVEKKKAFDNFKLAIPNIEKYVELTDDVKTKYNALYDLQKIYFKLEMYDKSNEAKKKKDELNVN